jgi:antitoxin FitA
LWRFRFATATNELPSLTIKRIPESLMDRLRASAEANRRSLNSEVLVRLESSLGGEPLDVDRFLRSLDELHRQAPVAPLTDEILEQARSQGRP